MEHVPSHPMLPGQVGRQTLSSVIAEQLLERIRAGRLRPGERLPTEHELAGEFGVSRSTVRKAVQALVAMGLIDVRPSRGAVILGVSSTSALDTPTLLELLRGQRFDDLYRLRLTLESETAAKAARRADPASLRAVARAQERCRDAHDHDPEAFHVADVAFHRALATACGNPIYGNILDALADLMLTAGRATSMIALAVSTALDEHDAVLEAVAAHDPDRARAAMRAHIQAGIHFLDEVRRGDAPPDSVHAVAPRASTGSNGHP